MGDVGNSVNWYLAELWMLGMRASLSVIAAALGVKPQQLFHIIIKKANSRLFSALMYSGALLVN